MSALGVCVAMAVSSGSRGLEAAVVLTDAEPVSPLDLEVLRDFGGAGVAVHVGDPTGRLGDDHSDSDPRRRSTQWVTRDTRQRQRRPGSNVLG